MQLRAFHKTGHVQADRDRTLTCGVHFKGKDRKLCESRVEVLTATLDTLRRIEDDGASESETKLS